MTYDRETALRFKAWLIEHGLTEEGTCGLMANIYSESGFRANNLQNSGERKLGMTDDEYVATVDSGVYTNFVQDRHGFGICQWTFYSRKQALLDFAKAKGASIGDETMQLEYLMYELQEKYPTVLNLLKSSHDERECAIRVMLDFERPANQTEENQQKRADHATTLKNDLMSKQNEEGNMRDLTVLHPALQAKWAELVALCAEHGYIIKNTSTYRNASEQAECVAKGTSSLFYPDSLHNWGVAVDFCRNDGKGAYNDGDGFFTKVGRLAESIGLIWGGSFSKVDKPHLQLADWGKTADLLKQKYGNDPTAFRMTWPTDTSLPKEEVKVDTVPATGLAIGDAVFVNGTIYGTGKGGGGKIKKEGALMYIVDYAGANNPHSYGVAKKKNGTRQGWAAPGILSKEAQEVVEQGYKKWHALCNERNTNVRTGAGTNHDIMRAWPMLGIGNEVEVIGEGMAPNGRLWYQILIQGQYKGWVYGGFLDRR